MSQSAQALFKSVGGDDLKITKLFDVKDWVVLVTGGSLGLGLVTAKALVDNGARVYISGRRKEPLEAAARDIKGVIPIVADASNKEGIRKMRDEIMKKEKYLNCLINSEYRAGVAETDHGVSLSHGEIDRCEQTPEGLSKEMFESDRDTFDIWGELYRINTASYHFTTFAFLPLLAAAKTIGGHPEPGNVINISSMSGITITSQHGQFSYNASKAATILLSKMQATEFARRNLGIRVNVVCPGYFPSGMTVIEPEENQGTDEHFQRFRKELAIPFGRPGNAIDYAQCMISLMKEAK